MNNLIIVGAGGLGRNIYHLAKECSGYKRDYTIKGFIDDDDKVLDGFDNYPPIINSITKYQIEGNDVFVCSIGSVKTKIEITNSILNRGGRFITLIHPTASINETVHIGNGCIISRNTILGSESFIDDFVIIQAAVVVGHDTRIGKHVRIDCHAVCVGGTIVEDEVTIHTSAIINHKVTVGKGAIVGAGSFVIRKVKPETTVIGNPAKRFK